MAVLLPSSWHDKDQDPMATSRNCDDIGGRLKVIEQSVAVLGAKVDKILKHDALRRPERELTMQAELQDVATRIERMELLLLRTPLPDFKVLDDTIANLISQAQAPSKYLTSNMNESSFSMHEVSDIKVSLDKASCDSAVNISINPEYVDQFCIEETDTQGNATADAAETMQKQYRDLWKPLHEDSTHMTHRCNAPMCSEDHEISLESTKWYTCPCCYVLCCSLACYRSHCKKCGKHFRLDEEGEEEEATQEQIAPLEQMTPCSHLDASDLHDLENSDDGEDELGAEDLADGQLEELAARVESGDLDIEDLTDGEARSLHAQLKNSSLGISWSGWKPWWQPAVADEHSEAAALSPRATRPSALKAPSHICCTEGLKPHACVALTSLSALYAYVHTMRSFNGGWEWAPLEAAPHLLRLCPAIFSRQVYGSAEECLRSSLAAAAALPHEGFGAEFDLLCLADTCALICSGADYCACALQDIVEIFEACLAGGGCGCAKKLQRGMRKLEFLTSFAFHHFELLQPVAAVAGAYVGEYDKSSCQPLCVQIGQEQDAKST